MHLQKNVIPFGKGAEQRAAGFSSAAVVVKGSHFRIGPGTALTTTVPGGPLIRCISAKSDFSSF